MLFSSMFRALLLPALPAALLIGSAIPAHAKSGQARPTVSAARAHGGKTARAPRGRTAAPKSHPHPVTRTSTKTGTKTVAKKTVFLERRVPAVKGGLPNVQALGALVVDENGRELFSRSPDHERPIASISKLAATLAVMDRGLELEGLTTITRSDVDAARGGARSRLLEGMTLSNRDLLHAALMGSDNRAIPALGRAVKLTPSQLAEAMTAKARQLGLKKTRFHDPTGLSIENVSTPRETIAMLQAVMRNPVLGPITQRIEYDAHPVGKPPITYFNTYRPAMRSNVHVLGGKTGYNDDARYCLVLAAKIDGQTCYMSFLANEGKLTRFGDVARVADWMVARKGKPALASAPVLTAAPVPALSSAPAPVVTPAPILAAAPPSPPPPVLPSYDVGAPTQVLAAAPVSPPAPVLPTYDVSAPAQMSDPGMPISAATPAPLASPSP